MLKVIIVDDEAVVRIGLKSMIDWQGAGFELVGEAENGEKALALIQNQKPDIVLTDIKMPGMNGLELISYPYKHEKPIFIVLSSYDDFHYVKGALKAGAQDYLLKLEVTPELLLEIMNHAARQCGISMEPEKGKKTEGSLHDTMRNIFYDLISDVPLSEKRRETFLKPFGGPPEPEAFGCLILRVMDPNKFDSISDTELHMLNTSVINIVEEILNEYYKGYCIAGYHGSYYVVFVPENGMSGWERPFAQIDELKLRITTLIAQYLNLNITAKAGSGGNGIAGAKEAYAKALSGFDESEMGGDSHWLVSKALGYINAHFQENICLDDVARHVGLSESYLSKILKQGTGKSYSKLLIQARIERAKYLLGSTEEKVYEVSRQVGYSNPYYFDRIFKSIAGVSPSDYRNRRKR